LVCKPTQGVIVAFDFVTGEMAVHNSDVRPAFTVPQSEFINDERISKLTLCQHLLAKALAYYRVVHCHQSLENQPAGVESKPATLRWGFHNRFMV
jgi:hypothetical protein